MYNENRIWSIVYWCTKTEWLILYMSFHGPKGMAGSSEEDVAHGRYRYLVERIWPPPGRGSNPRGGEQLKSSISAGVGPSSPRNARDSLGKAYLLEGEWKWPCQLHVILACSRP